MGSLISLPKTITDLNEEINGSWFRYIRLKSLLAKQDPIFTNRFKLHDSSSTGLRQNGIVPQDIEWTLERPNKLVKKKFN